MWKTFKHNGNLYMIKVQQTDGLRLSLTDLQQLWVQEISTELVLQQFKEFNPLFNIKLLEAVSEVNHLIERISELENIDLTTTENELSLVLKTCKSQYDIEFRFQFVKASADEFLKEVTVPLIQTVKYLENNQRILSNVVQKKDRELEEYKLEKGPISREDLMTEKFDETSLDQIDDKSMMNVFGNSDSFWDCFVQKHGKIENKLEDVQKDPWNHIKRKRKVYSSKTAIKKGKGIDYN